MQRPRVMTRRRSNNDNGKWSARVCVQIGDRRMGYCPREWAGNETRMIL